MGWGISEFNQHNLFVSEAIYVIKEGVGWFIEILICVWNLQCFFFLKFEAAILLVKWTYI